MTEKEIQTTILENIQTRVSPQVYQAYFSEIQVFSVDDSMVTIACKNAFTKQTIENRFYNTLLKIVRDTLSIGAVELQFVIKSISSTAHESAKPNLFSGKRMPSGQTSTTSPSLQGQPSQQTPTRPDTFLNRKYVFDSFIVGTHNQLAHAAAIAIADSPGTAYNPFFIYGGVGLGKTHLMQAIGNKVLSDSPSGKVLYCTTETFLNEMISSIRNQKTSSFRDKYRAMDVLILDDVQFLSNKVALQEEFFNTFNTLYQAGKQIVIASDRPPGEISHLEERIRSRFEGGLVADIQSPDYETRVAILQRKLQDRNDFLPDALIDAIAENMDSNIRELEGALLKVLIHYKTSGNLTAPDVQVILGTKIREKRRKINPLDIMKVVCEELEVELKDVKSQKRNYDIAYARQICMYLLKDMLNLQLVKIAKHVGRKDHTTVMHGISKIEELLKSDLDTSRLVSNLKAKIG